MTGLILVLILLAAGAVAWYYRSQQRGAVPRPIHVLPLRAGKGRRFTGIGIVPSASGPPRARAVVAAGAGGGRRAARFSGSAYVPPNAIGLACGKPVAECTRGDDCLCIF